MFILIIIISVILALVYSNKGQAPKYETSISIALTKNNLEQDVEYIDREDVMLNQELINNYDQMIQSEYTLEKVIQSCSLNYSSEQLGKMITTEVLADTTIIIIHVESQDSSETVTIANGLVDELKQQVEDTYQLDNIKIISPAKEPQNTSNLSTLTLIILYVFIAMAFTALILFTLYYIKS